MATRTGLELTSRVTKEGELQLAVSETAVPAPGADEVVVRIQAAPISPSDLALLLGPLDISTLRADGNTTTARIPEARMVHLTARLDQAMKVGNEGAGVVVEAGANAQALLGKTVSAAAGAMFSQFRVVKQHEVTVLPEGITAEQGASVFVNPMTVLCMLETMRREGHTAIVHTAAASNLGQMLVKVCKQDGVGLVNIVRSADHVKLLKELGAVHVLDSTSPTFAADLVEACVATKATIAFDAIGGGTLASQILTAMEHAANRTAKTYSRYGSATHKQVYIYGSLDVRPTTLDRTFGLSWGVAGWLVLPTLLKLGPEAGGKLRDRVLAELTTTFASHYTATISLREAITPDVIQRYAKRATGEKYLIDPSK
ncbi:MAG: zinc-binding dehydrogenase [Deltaproteobacteria bacterium]